MTMNRSIGGIAFVTYVAVILAANWAVTNLDPVSVGFGLVAPAGVYFIGFAFTARDVMQRQLGIWPTLVAIALGAGLSYLIADPAVAAASLVAFGVSELADFAVYTPLRGRDQMVLAVLASGIVGLILDSWLFLQIAFGNLDFFRGQVVGKLWAVLLSVVLIKAIDLALDRRGQAAIA